MSAELATTSHNGAATLGERMTYAKALAAASMLPSAYRNRPADVLVAIETGSMLGIAPMAAITNVNIIEGKPTFSAGLMSALVRRAGHTIRASGDDQHGVCEIVRSDDPDYTFRSEWTWERAEQAGLTGKGNWKRYPAAMLKARAVSEACRDAASDVFLGPVYVPEELGAEVDADGDVITPTPTTTAASAAPVSAAPSGAESQHEANVEDAEIVDEPASTSSDSQPQPVADSTSSSETQQDATGEDGFDWDGAIDHALEFEHASHRREAFVELYSLAVTAHREGTCSAELVQRIAELGSEAATDMEQTQQLDTQQVA